jgi:type IV secretory pathway VirB4 component
MFDGPSTVAFDADSPMVSVDLSRVTENAAAMSVLMTCCSAWMESALADPDGGQRWVVYDEAWRLMQHPSLLRRMDAHWRLARHYGIANLLVFHKLSDLDNVGDAGSANRALATSLLANAETRIVYRQETDQLGRSAGALGLTGTERALLPVALRDVHSFDGLGSVGCRQPMDFGCQCRSLLRGERHFPVYPGRRTARALLRHPLHAEERVRS